METVRDFETPAERHTAPKDHNLVVRSIVPLLIALAVAIAAVVAQSTDYPASGTLPCDLGCFGI